MTTENSPTNQPEDLKTKLMPFAAAPDGAFKRGKKDKRDRALERENRDLKTAVTDLSIRHALMKQAQALRPYPPARSPR